MTADLPILSIDDVAMPLDRSEQIEVLRRLAATVDLRIPVIEDAPKLDDPVRVDPVRVDLGIVSHGMLIGLDRGQAWIRTDDDRYITVRYEQVLLDPAAEDGDR